MLHQVDNEVLGEESDRLAQSKFIDVVIIEELMKLCAPTISGFFYHPSVINVSHTLNLSVHLDVGIQAQDLALALNTPNTGVLVRRSMTPLI